MIFRRIRLAYLFGALLGATPPALFAASPASGPCEADPAFHKLDFWVGRWVVFDSHDGSRAGSSVLTKVLRGCAVAVDWHEADGFGEIEELFYYEKARKLWKQVWISDAGPAKERNWIEDLPDGSIRFLGTVYQLDGGSHLDRSTVTPLPGGRVHQFIEISRDEGKTWLPTFDGEYRPAKT